MRKPRKLIKIEDKDEFKHEYSNYKEHHNESWYFNFIDFKSNTHMVTRVGYRLGAPELETMLIRQLEE